MGNFSKIKVFSRTNYKFFRELFLTSGLQSHLIFLDRFLFRIRLNFQIWSKNSQYTVK
jgi:hypothetical protein